MKINELNFIDIEKKFPEILNSFKLFFHELFV